MRRRGAPRMLMRSKLFVPASRPELFAKAEASAADALSFDLEDAVAESRKDEARALLAGHLKNRNGAGKTVVVRINAAGTNWFEQDVAAIAGLADIINLPMVQSAADILRLAQMLDGQGAAAEIMINVETPAALRRAGELAGAHKRVTSL